MAGLEGNSQVTVDGNVVDVDFDNSQSISTISLTDGLNVVEEVDEDNENIEVLQIRMKEIAEEKEKFKQIQLEMEKQMELSFFSPKSPPGSVNEDKIETDARSVYVGNVDYNATTQELEEHFHGCGIINRITIPCDKYSGNPKGFAYIEFGDKDSIHIALTLDESLFKGRQIKVIPKRTNKPGISTTNRPPRFASPYLRRYSKINRGMMRYYYNRTHKDQILH